MPLRGLVHDSPIITAIQYSTRRAKKRAEANSDFDYAKYGFSLLFAPLMRKIQKNIEKN